MSELPPPPAHLNDEILNEYLDQALTPAQYTAVDAHLAACADCGDRLETLRAVFADLDALPEVALRRDLSAAVMAQLPRRTPPVLRPALRWVIAAQALLAVILLAVSGPPLLSAIAWPTAPETLDSAAWAALTQITTEAAALAQTLTATAEDGLAAARGFSATVSTSAASAWAALLIPLVLLWLFGNGVLVGRLRAQPPPAANHSRSHR